MKAGSTEGQMKDMKEMKNRIIMMMALMLVVTGIKAQSVFSPNVNGLRSSFQSRRAAVQDSNQERGFFVVTCSVDASAAAIANQMIEMGGEIRSLLANQVLVDLPMAQLDNAAAIEGVLLIDIPSNGTQKTDIARKKSQVDEAHQGKAEGMSDLPQAYTGKGIIIGLIDGGYDFTHPMFKDKDGNLRIKGVYQPATEKYRAEGESLSGIQVTDDKGETTTLTLTGSYFANPDIILDTLKVKDDDGSHATHCASIAAGRHMDYQGDFHGRDANSGKLGGMAPDAELILAQSGTTEEQQKLYPQMANYLRNYNNMQGMYALKHFAAKQNKPLVISWSENDHEGLHDGTSTMARYIGNYCKQGNVMALCSSNEGSDSMYLARTITQGKSLKVWCKNAISHGNVNFLFRTDKEVKADLAITDKNGNVVYECKLPLTSTGTEEYKGAFSVTYKIDDDYNKTYEVYPAYYLGQDFLQKLGEYLTQGTLVLEIAQGTGLDKNNKQFTYTHAQLTFYGQFDTTPGDDMFTSTQNYYPMVIFTAAGGDVEMQCWGDYFSNYADSMEEPGVLKPGSSENSMGDWCTSGEAVTIGAYVTDNRVPVFGEMTPNPDEPIGRYASFSSYGHDFSTDHLAYPDVVAPGYQIYAAANSFDNPDQAYAKTSYSNQFKGQDKPRIYPYTLMSGTSMSTPAAAGIIALWMQAAQDKGKTLTNQDIKDIIRHSSMTDEFTKANPLRYGAGKINAYKGLLYVLGINTAIPELPSEHIKATLDGRTLRISGDLSTRVTIYNLSGQKLLDAQSENGSVELPNLPSGVYAVKIGNQGSTLIRL